MPRCPWCEGPQLYMDYHDQEWGVPEYDSQQLFEKIILDGAQAGLSWYTILSKRENYREAFDGFDPEVIARYDEAKFNELMQNAGIVRNKLKINAAITNAQAYLKLQEQGIPFRDYLWRYVDGKPLVNHFKGPKQVPALTPLSDQVSKQLKKDGFKFVGSTIIYAFMQAVGMVNDHLIDCDRHKEIIESY
jgi:DNA-3-methyladenine glycosylase I